MNLRQQWTAFYRVARIVMERDRLLRREGAPRERSPHGAAALTGLPVPSAWVALLFGSDPLESGFLTRWYLRCRDYEGFLSDSRRSAEYWWERIDRLAERIKLGAIEVVDWDDNPVATASLATDH